MQEMQQQVELVELVEEQQVELVELVEEQQEELCEKLFAWVGHMVEE